MEHIRLLRLIFFILLGFTLSACSLVPNEWTVEPGEVLFQDDFSNPSSGWQRASTAGGILDYDGGGFRFLVTAPDFNFWSVPGKSFSNVIMDVDVARLTGPVENRMGLICRYSDSNNYYFFVISSDGYYGIGKVVGGQLSLIGQTEMLYTPAIQQGLVVNHLQAQCVGDQLIFYINDSPMPLASDAALTKGDVGLLAGTFDQPDVDVVFDNFVVVKP
jgi:hypothetical protein